MSMLGVNSLLQFFATVVVMSVVLAIIGLLLIAVCGCRKKQ